MRRVGLGGVGVRRQDLADALDAESMRRLLPASAVRAVAVWLSGAGAQYVNGVGGHAVQYVPAQWAGIEPWPEGLSDRTRSKVSVVSRAQVVAAVRAAVERQEWSEALVASYVWGQGRTGYGPHRLKDILAEPTIVSALAQAVVLREEGAVAAYRAMYGAVKGLGPAFFTKFLYFLDWAMDAPSDSRALILDQRVARVLRAHATRVGLSMGLESADSVAAWVWSDTGWTPHRYGVYLRWMTAAAGQLASSGIGWPDSSPGLLELAMFNGIWEPMA
ncbi:8-oxoguanine DNA glycosylase OGG fold protein [Streptomyces sp. NPDC003753]